MRPATALRSKTPSARAAMLLGLAGLLLAACGSQPVPEERTVSADWILRGGRIHTLRDDQPSTVDAIALGDGRVLAIGSIDEVMPLADADTRVVELHGAFVLPGLVDAHAHLLGLGQSLQRVDLRGTASAEECVQRVRAFAPSLPGGTWIRGRGWDQNDWDDTRFPDRALLDAAFPDRPVVLGRVDGHALWVDSEALRRAGIDASTPDPPGGEIVRDPVTGEPTGVLVDNATDLVTSRIEAPSAAEMEAAYRRAIAHCVGLGLTGIHDMGATVEQIDVLRRAEEEGWLDLRVVSYLSGASTLAAWPGGPWRPAASARLRVQGVKFYADGALGSRGAALLQDYTDRPGHRGLLVTEPAVLREGVIEAWRRGFQPAIHAIGDRANRIALDVFAEARRVTGTAAGTLPARIEHAQIVAPEDLPRFSREGVVPSMQPTHCTSDMPWAPERLGPDRLAGAYAWRTLRDLGNPIPLGSDFPVEKASPWRGLYAARTRQTPEGQPPGGWSPEQRLTALEALLGFTAWPAQVIGENAWGRLDVGYRADLVVADVDPLDPDPRVLLEATVLMTMVDGEVVHARAHFSDLR